MFCSIGRVCVPIDVERIDDFDPFQVPTVSQLCYEFETAGTNKGKKGTFTVKHMPFYSTRCHLLFFSLLRLQ